MKVESEAIAPSTIATWVGEHSNTGQMDGTRIFGVTGRGGHGRANKGDVGGMVSFEHYIYGF